MSRWKGLPWALPSAQLWQTSSWSSLKSKHYSHHQTPIYCGRGFVDDTFVIINKADKDEFLTHINSVDHNIQFTAEEPGPGGSLPFLDILISPDEEGRLVTSVYRKPTHTDQYLQWDSHHPISAKYSVVGTLYHRAKTISSNNDKLHKEDTHLTRALGDCKYPRWAVNRVKMRMNNPTKTQKKKNEQYQPNTPRPYITVPYYRGLSESFKKKCSNLWCTSIL